MMNIKSWVVPVVIALGLFLVVRPVVAQAVEGESLVLGEVQVGEEINNGFLRVYYIEGGNKVFVSLENQNSKHVHMNGEYVVWATEIADRPGQVYRHHIPTGATIQITNSGTNLQPKVDANGNVVWEGWTNDAWQVFFFDGTSVRQLTEGDASMNPDIQGGDIVYARRDLAGTWRAVGYSISQNKSVEITTGQAAKHPRLADGEVYLGSAGDVLGEKFPLNIDDLFLLGFDDVPVATSSGEVTVEEVLEELTATPSAEVVATTSAILDE